MSRETAIERSAISISPRLGQWLADLRALFWLRPAGMTLTAVVLAETLVRVGGQIELPAWVSGFVYAGGVAGARDVLGVIAGATIGLAGTTFSITVAALTLASNQMGPRLLRNFTRNAGNQYALGALVATFAYSLVALRAVHEDASGASVPQLAVSVALLLAFACVGVLVWFIHHVATSINVNRVIALVYEDLASAVAALPTQSDARKPAGEGEEPNAPTAPLLARDSNYLRVLDDAALADWAEQQRAVLRLVVRPGDFVFAGTVVGHVVPATVQEEAQTALARSMTLGEGRDVEQDLEYAVRQLVEIGLRALSPSLNDPFTATAVIDRLGAALCDVAGRVLPDGRTWRDGIERVHRPATGYGGLLDAMFHMLRQAAADQPAVLIRLLEVLAAVAEVERDPARMSGVRQHAELTRVAAEGGRDPTVAAAAADRYARVLAALGSAGPEAA